MTRRASAVARAAFALGAWCAAAAPGLADRPIPFADLPGWAVDDHAAAFAAFRRGCAAVRGRGAKPVRGPADPKRLAAVCAEALREGAASAATARRFFESRFVAVELSEPGFLTGYYEPELAGSLAPSPAFPAPLYRVPADLMPIPAGARSDGVTAGRRTGGGRLVPYDDRAAIDAGSLAGRGLELVYLADPVTAFFVHIQGSARIRLGDGRILRVGFAAKNGWPYTPIGRILIERGEIARADMTAARLEAWLRAHPAEAPALMRANRSYIFFRPVEGLDPALGPVGALGVQLTPGRSLAVDPAELPLGLPVFLDAALPLGPGGGTVPVRRLTVAADTGSAIRGAARGDLFLGSGEAAGRAAGLLRHPARFVVLVPRESGR